MFSRLVIVFLLVLVPLQWSAAQGHELADDAGAFSAVLEGGSQLAQLLEHHDEPGGVCQFHELVQPGAMLIAPGPENLLRRCTGSWRLARKLAPPGSRSPHDIEKPKWSGRPSVAASS
ncbi:hypothetical protein [Xylophilus sp. ASV27]|uniref:hypothetical protein n=1 Tax=Xylophilus sp. ASV27 TaxID=2795129 RepID=UPI0018EC5134|nr:hypothetical protein [Xylophilus sp. ASV27]